MNRSLAKSFGFTLPWSLTFLFIWLFPLGYAFVMGLTDFNLLRPDETSWVGFENYRALFSKSATIFCITGLIFESVQNCQNSMVVAAAIVPEVKIRKMQITVKTIELLCFILTNLLS